MQLKQFNISNQSVGINRADIYAVLGVSDEVKALVDEYIDDVFMNGPELLEVSGGYMIVEDVETDIQYFSTTQSKRKDCCVCLHNRECGI